MRGAKVQQEVLPTRHPRQTLLNNQQIADTTPKANPVKQSTDCRHDTQGNRVKQSTYCRHDTQGKPY